MRLNTNSSKSENESSCRKSSKKLFKTYFFVVASVCKLVYKKSCFPSIFLFLKERKSRDRVD